MSSNTDNSELLNAIAIVGMSGRFPGARNVEEFWRNLRDGVESITFFPQPERKSESNGHSATDSPLYVGAKATLSDIELFDAAFFGFSPRDAEITDPQHRIFLECAWEALERAGYDPKSYDGPIAVYAGVSMSSYLVNLYSNAEIKKAASSFQIHIANDKDHLPTRVSYKLNLRGPSVSVQTACSTSLVAVHLACQGLLNYQCDIALSGGASIVLPQDSGYFYQEDGILSPDGHCRAFDARAQGTVCGNGVGVVVLKRLEDALKDRDFIHAIIRGSAFNNDGSSKVGYTAPSVSGQAEVIAMAQAMAGAGAETISYVEAHGTGTTLGDPIEIKALTQAFRASTKRRNFCAIGSVKTNIGHLDAAAGVAGLIKTALALENRMIPPSLHFERPNPEINFDETPFYVNKELSHWKAGPTPRRAGVSSFGIGGTNAHIILEEAPHPISNGSANPFHLLAYSAKTAAALERVTANLCEHLMLNLDLDLADVAFTLQSSRSSFAHRRVAICSDVKDAIATLSGQNQQRLLNDCQETRRRPLAFMFSGQGSQYVNMGRELYQSEPLFREKIDQCSKLAAPHVGFDLRRLLYPEADAEGEAKEKVNETSVAQPLLFAVEFALASLLIQCGAKPDSMIGHSIGEYVAACLAGVFSLEDALALVAKRGRLMQSLPKGAMVSVALGESEILPLLGKGLSLAAVNAPSLCVVSGPKNAVEDFEKALADRKVITRRLHTSHAFHSEMMEPILDSFARAVKGVRRNRPQMPFISNVTGTWIKPDEATDSEYWVTHLRNTVRFRDGVRELLKAGERVLVEIGPGRTLSTLAKQQVEIDSDQAVFNLLPAATDEGSDFASFLKGVGRLWLSGVKLNWDAFNAKRKGRRIPLPTYPFDRQRYWVEPSKETRPSNGFKPHLHKKTEIKEWFYAPAWTRASETRLPIEYSLQESDSGWVVFLDDSGLGERIVRRLEKENQSVVTVRKGERFAQIDAAQFVIDAASKTDYDRLVQAAWNHYKKPGRVIHLWSVTTDDDFIYGFDRFQQAQQDGLMSLLFLAQALSNNNITDPLKVDIISNNLHEITGNERLYPERATVIAACKVFPQEYTNLKVSNIDLNFEDESGKDIDKLADRVLSEIISNAGDSIVAYRGRFRWIQTFEQVRIDAPPRKQPLIRQRGVYLITGGLGAIGLTIAEHLAQTFQAKIILAGRTALGDPAKLDRIKAMEDAGAEVIVCRANVADEQQMEAVIARAYQQFGELNGVIHAAGAEHRKSVRAIQETEPYDCFVQFEPKAKALFVLEKVLRDRQIDFCLLQSSLSAILGGLGFYAYAAANIFMDAFAVRQNREAATPWISANWDGWHMGKTKTNGDLGISPAEGVAALAHILATNPLPQVIVSTGNLQQRIDRWIKLEQVREEGRDVKQEITLYPRPALQNNYTPPRTEIEQNVIEMWTQLLGIDRIGIHDNFFDLGGHSLLAIQLISRLRDNFHVELPLRSLFDTPTVSDLVISILARQAEQADSDLLAQVLVEMGHAPADEAHLTLIPE